MRRERRALRSDRDRQDLPLARSPRRPVPKESEPATYGNPTSRTSGARVATGQAASGSCCGSTGRSARSRATSGRSSGRTSCSGGCYWSFSSCATGGYRPSYVHSAERRTGTRGLGGGVHTDAIMDRIVHNAVWLEMGDMNMRQAMAGKGR